MMISIWNVVASPMTPADRKIAMEWYAKEYPRRNRDAEKVYNPVELLQDAAESRDELVEAYTAGLSAGREWAAGVVDGWNKPVWVQEEIAAEIRKGPQ